MLSRCPVDENDASLTEIEVGFMQSSCLICVVSMKMMPPIIEGGLMKVIL